MNHFKNISFNSEQDSGHLWKICKIAVHKSVLLCILCKKMVDILYSINCWYQLCHFWVHAHPLCLAWFQTAFSAKTLQCEVLSLNNYLLFPFWLPPPFGDVGKLNCMTPRQNVKNRYIAKFCVANFNTKQWWYQVYNLILILIVYSFHQ